MHPCDISFLFTGLLGLQDSSSISISMGCTFIWCRWSLCHDDGILCCSSRGNSFICILAKMWSLMCPCDQFSILLNCLYIIVAPCYTYIFCIYCNQILLINKIKISSLYNVRYCSYCSGIVHIMFDTIELNFTFVFDLLQTVQWSFYCCLSVC